MCVCECNDCGTLMKGIIYVLSPIIKFVGLILFWPEKPRPCIGAESSKCRKIKKVVGPNPIRSVIRTEYDMSFGP